MKLRIVFLVAILGAVFSSLEAQEYGGSLTTNTGLSGVADFGFNFSERIDAYASVPFGDKNNGFKAKANIAFKYDSALSQVKLTGDIDRLHFFWLFKGTTKADPDFVFEVGRMGFTEPSGLVLNSTADGFKIGYQYQAVEFEINAGYTGALLKDSSLIVLSKADSARSADKNNYFGPKRMLGQALATLPNLFGQKLQVAFTMQQDLNGIDSYARNFTTNYDPAKGGEFNSQYSTLKAEGLITPVPGLAYTGSFTWGSGTTFSWVEDATSSSGYSGQPSSIQSFMMVAGVEYYLPSFLASAFHFKIGGASGDSDASSTLEGNGSGAYTLFTPITPSTLGTAYSPVMSNLVFTQIGGTVKPVESMNMVTGAKLFNFFRPVKGATGASGAASDSAESYIGTGLDIFGTYRIMSDMVVSLNGGLFFPGGAFPTGGTDVKYVLQATFTLEM